MKTKNNENQSFGNVALYIRYEDEDLDEMKKKEEILVKYCEEHNCDIVKKYFDSDKRYIYPYFSDTMRNLLKEQDMREYDCLIACDINDLTEYMCQLVAINAILDDEDTSIVTINQGVLGEDMLLDGTYFENVMNKKELQEPRIQYDDSGKVIDTKEAPF